MGDEYVSRLTEGPKRLLCMLAAASGESFLVELVRQLQHQIVQCFILTAIDMTIVIKMCNPCSLPYTNDDCLRSSEGRD